MSSERGRMADVGKVMAILGKACYLGFVHAMDFEPHWDQLNKETKEAWIAAAHEALSIKHIITNEKGKPEEVA